MKEKWLVIPKINKICISSTSYN